MEEVIQEHINRKFLSNMIETTKVDYQYCKYCGINVRKSIYEKHKHLERHTILVKTYGENITDEDALKIKINYLMNHLEHLQRKESFVKGEIEEIQDILKNLKTN
jgi:hypothetical protein